MSSPCACCGCSIQDDYGTSTVTGDGSHQNPFIVEPVDSTEFVRPAVRAFGATDSIPASTPTLKTYSVANPETVEMFNVASPTLITMPYTGIYIIGGNITLAVTQTLGITLELLKNGTAIHTGVFSPGEGFSLNCTTSYVFYFNAGDTLQMRVTHHHSLGNANVGGGLWALYLGRGPV